MVQKKVDKIGKNPRVIESRNNVKVIMVENQPFNIANFVECFTLNLLYLIVG